MNKPIDKDYLTRQFVNFKSTISASSPTPPKNTTFIVKNNEDLALWSSEGRFEEDKYRHVFINPGEYTIQAKETDPRTGVAVLPVIGSVICEPGTVTIKVKNAERLQYSTIFGTLPSKEAFNPPPLPISVTLYYGTFVKGVNVEIEPAGATTYTIFDDDYTCIDCNVKVLLTDQTTTQSLYCFSNNYSINCNVFLEPKNNEPAFDTVKVPIMGPFYGTSLNCGFYLDWVDRAPQLNSTSVLFHGEHTNLEIKSLIKNSDSLGPLSFLRFEISGTYRNCDFPSATSIKTNSVLSFCTLEPSSKFNQVYAESSKFFNSRLYIYSNQEDSNLTAGFESCNFYNSFIEFRDNTYAVPVFSNCTVKDSDIKGQFTLNEGGSLFENCSLVEDTKINLNQSLNNKILAKTCDTLSRIEIPFGATVNETDKVLFCSGDNPETTLISVPTVLEYSYYDSSSSTDKTLTKLPGLSGK